MLFTVTGVKNIIRIGMFVTRGSYFVTWVEEHHSLYDYTLVFVILGRVVQSWVSAKYEFVFESLKSISVLILFVYKTMIGSSKISRENYPRKCFWTQGKETSVKFNPGLSANRPWNNWALGC